jgi:hypothetical protein
MNTIIWFCNLGIVHISEALSNKFIAKRSNYK